MPCHTLETLRDDPHLAAVGFFRSEQHPTEGATITLRPSIKFDGDYPVSGAPSQPKGWETRSVMLALHISSDDIDALVEEGAAREAAR